MKRLVLIARASTDKQENSIESQVSRAREYAAANNITLIEAPQCLEYVSGKHVMDSKRQGPAHALGLIKAGQADGVYVLRLDRLGRSVQQICEFAEQLRNVGGVLVSGDMGALGDSAIGRAFLQTMAVMAELERNLIRERTKEGLRVVKERGPMPGKKEIGRPRSEKLTAVDTQTVLNLYATTGSYKAVAVALGLHAEQVRRIVTKHQVLAGGERA